MKSACAKLPLFADGELTPDEKSTFTGHLAVCPDCPAALRELLILDDLVEEAVSARPAVAIARPQSRRRFVAGAGLSLAVAAAAFVVLRPGRPDSDALLLALADTPTRAQMVRVSRPAADRHRPFNPVRAGGGAPTNKTPAAVSSLAAIESSGDARALAAAYFLLGLPAQAEVHLPAEDGSADALSDRAAVLIERGELDAADTLLLRALALQPRHKQARWNRALVLRARGDRAGAARLFQELAADEQGGWADEARSLARDLLP